MNRTDKVIAEQIDANKYTDDQLLQVKVPLNMPYVINSDYERVDGKIEYQGEHYNYVKRKVSNDTLYLMCLPNKAKTQLTIATSNFTRTVNDIPSNKKDAGPLVKKGGLTPEYNHIFVLYQFKNNVASTRQENGFISSTPALIFIPHPAQPPELA